MGVDIGMRNLALCILDPNTHQVVYMDVLDILLEESILCIPDLAPREKKKIEKKTKKKKYASVYELVSGLVNTMNKQIDTYPTFLDIRHVIIENQPHFKLPHMKNIAIALHAYIATRIPNCIVQYMQATQKFAGLAGISKKQLREYRDRKKLAVECMKERLEHFGDSIAMTQLALYKKKDDIADAYLLGLQACV